MDHGYGLRISDYGLWISDTDWTPVTIPNATTTDEDIASVRYYTYPRSLFHRE